MCGIVGYIGKKNCIPTLIDGLNKLEYRGYDSAGIAYFLDSKTVINKTVGRVKDLDNIINCKDNSSIGIGHTRWATHGGAVNINAHPHKQGKITIVHNGIIENYFEIKEFLINNNYKFVSETDTEVACAYIDYLYGINNDMMSVLKQCTKKFIGSYAILALVDNDKKIYVIKKDSPMVIGMGVDGFFITSSSNAFDKDVNKYIILDDYDYGYVSTDEVKIYNDGNLVDKSVINFDSKNNISGMDGYKHYMLKEINEQSEIIRRLNSKYLNNLDNLIDISKFDNIHIVACGSAYHAGIVGKYLIESKTDISVNVYIASEYRYQKINYKGKTLFIAISQSGETADTIACIKKAKDNSIYTLGIVNVHDSSIARLTDSVIYTEAGDEIAVATTKGYLTQVYILSLLILRNISDKDDIISDYYKLPRIIKKLVNMNYSSVVDSIYENSNVFYLGRNIDYAVMLEGALKLKEISYIHAECYAAGELKHGTISLIEQGTPVVALITMNDIVLKTISNIKEVISRGANVSIIIKDSLLNNINNDDYNNIIIIDDVNDLIEPLISIIPLQLIAYNVALKLERDIDKPRNLAKSVTVE